MAYLSLDGLLKSCETKEKSGYCTACYTGNYPTQWVDVDEILPAQADRRDVQLKLTEVG